MERTSLTIRVTVQQIRAAAFTPHFLISVEQCLSCANSFFLSCIVVPAKKVGHVKSVKSVLYTVDGRCQTLYCWRLNGATPLSRQPKATVQVLPDKIQLTKEWVLLSQPLCAENPETGFVRGQKQFWSHSIHLAKQKRRFDISNLKYFYIFL